MPGGGERDIPGRGKYLCKGFKIECLLSRFKVKRILVAGVK